MWEDTLNYSASFIDGDFDLDGRIEFITGCPLSVGGLVLAWECVGDNDVLLIFQDTLPWSNNYDVFKQYFTRDDVFNSMNLVNLLNAILEDLTNYERLSYFNELIIKLDQIKLGLLYGESVGKPILSEDFVIDREE